MDLPTHVSYFFSYFRFVKGNNSSPDYHSMMHYIKDSISMAHYMKDSDYFMKEIPFMFI